MNKLHKNQVYLILKVNNTLMRNYLKKVVLDQQILNWRNYTNNKMILYPNSTQD